eukprot:5123119-Lingulodinium_polyedra.AAC.1
MQLMYESRVMAMTEQKMAKRDDELLFFLKARNDRHQQLRGLQLTPDDSNDLSMSRCRFTQADLGGVAAKSSGSGFSKAQ